MLKTISNLILPTFVLIIVIHGVTKKINIYDIFIDGAKESLEIAISMFPSLLAMILGINLFLNSNFLNYLFTFIKPIINIINIPTQILPLVLMRPISGSASLSILNNILKTYGPDGFIGHLASIIQGSTETTFYVLTLYFGSIGIKKIKYAMWVSLFADLVGVIASIIIATIIF